MGGGDAGRNGVPAASAVVVLRGCPTSATDRRVSQKRSWADMMTAMRKEEEEEEEQPANSCTSLHF